MILGLLNPTSGYAEVEGLRSSEAPNEVKRRVGLVSTSAGLYQWLSARELLLFFADSVWNVAGAGRGAVGRVDDLDGFGAVPRSALRDVEHRAATARASGAALIHDPPIMLLDEPTRGLDVFGSQAIFDYISQLRREGRAVIVTTHRLDEAQRLCDRFGLMHRGRFVLEGTLEELRQKSGRDTIVEMFMEMTGHRQGAARCRRS